MVGSNSTSTVLQKAILVQRGCGAILRDENGNCKEMIVVPIGSQTNHKEKAMATLQGILLAKICNCPYLWIEGDSNNIIKCLKGTSKPSWTINNIIKATKDLINTFEKCFISHIYREANGSTNWAANVAVIQHKMITWKGEEHIPDDVRTIIFKDRYNSTPKIING